MKKFTFYIGEAILLASSAAMVFLASYWLTLQMAAVIAAGVLLCLAAAWKFRDFLVLMPAVLFVAFCHLFYLFMAYSLGQALLVAMVLSGFGALCALYFMYRRQSSPWLAVNGGFLIKMALIPEMFVNLILYASSGDFDFVLLTFILMLIGSGYIWMGLYLAHGPWRLSKGILWIVGLLQLVWGADVLAAVFLAWKLSMTNPVKEEKKQDSLRTPLYAKPSFSRVSMKAKKEK